METIRKYPIGIQTFSRIRREGLVCVDKTVLVWQLAHYSTYIDPNPQFSTEKITT
jgi:hypothetical protein